jgi:hypothetical protein
MSIILNDGIKENQRANDDIEEILIQCIHSRPRDTMEKSGRQLSPDIYEDDAIVQQRSTGNLHRNDAAFKALLSAELE